MRTKNNPLLIISALLLLLAAGGLFLINRDTNPVEEKGRISGFVTDAETGIPLQDVTVTAISEEDDSQDGQTITDVTGKDGSFSIELPEGKYTLRFEAEHYVRLDSTASYPVDSGKNREIEEAFRLVAERTETELPQGSPDRSGTEDAGSPDHQPESPQSYTAGASEAAGQPSVVPYEIKCVDENGSELKTIQQEGSPGTSMSVRAPSIEGYYPLTDELTVTLSDSAASNIITFVYESEYEEDEEEYVDTLIPPDAISYNGHRYYAYQTTGINSFEEAELYAESLGGYLAIIGDSAENEVLYNYVFGQRGLKSAYFGLTDAYSEGEWYWVDGSPVSYEHWGPGQPDNINGVEDFGLFYYKDDPFDWNDGDFGKDKDDGTVIFLIEWDS